MEDRDLTPQDLELVRDIGFEHRTRHVLRGAWILGMVLCFGLAGLGIRDMHAEATDVGRHADVLSGTRALNRRLEGLLMRAPDVMGWMLMGTIFGFCSLGDPRSRRRDALLLKLAQQRLDPLR